MNFRRQNGLTLVEILIVIGIVIVLTAIIFPIYSRTQLKAKQTSRIAQFKNLGIAFELYCADHSGSFPRSAGRPASSWMDSLSAYVGDERLFLIEESGLTLDSRYTWGTGLSMNQCIFGKSDPPQFNTIVFQATARFQRVGDPQFSLTNHQLPCPDRYAVDRIPGDWEIIGGKYLSEYFFGGAIYLRLDGSAKWIDVKKFDRPSTCSCDLPAGKEPLFESTPK